MWRQLARSYRGLLSGILFFLAVLLLPIPEGMSPEALRVAAVAVLMATWWVTEAAPMAVTALLPVVLFPLLGIMSTANTTVAYANHLVFLFMGGFLIGATMQKWNLHRRIAMHTLRIVGGSPQRIILGFMLATALLSMWISNTATALMMLPIASAVINQVQELNGVPARDVPGQGSHRTAFAISLMLGIAYSASIGGVATLIGTPPNAILAGMAEKLYGLKIGFVDWMLFALPVSLLMLGLCWYYLTRIAYPLPNSGVQGVNAVIESEISRLGPVKREERLVLGVFSSVSAAWVLRGFIDIPVLSLISDASIAIAGAVLLFIIPADPAKRKFLLDWETAKGIPWEILILFGGGFALAQSFSDSGLSLWIAQQLSVLAGSPLFVLITVVTLCVIFLTEVTSNTATATLMLPVLGALSVTLGIHPYSLMVPGAIAASFAFMLPVATPPNAIVFGSGHLSIPLMVRAGIWMNIIAVVLISAFVLFLLPAVWDLEMSVPIH